MQIHFHKHDIPEGINWGSSVAIDTEAMGLLHYRDRLCLVQLSAGDGHCHLVQISKNVHDAPRLKTLLSDPKIVKIFHFARFDVAALEKTFGVECAPIYCTKIASKLVRTFTDRHGLKDLCRELLGVEISKQEQTSDWGAETLSDDQKRYAATDVLHLHKIKDKLDIMLAREGQDRVRLAQKCFDFLPYRARLDLSGWDEVDIFSH